MSQIFKELNIPTARFADFNVRNQSYYFIGDKYFKYDKNTGLTKIFFTLF